MNLKKGLLVLFLVGGTIFANAADKKKQVKKEFLCTVTVTQTVDYCNGETETTSATATAATCSGARKAAKELLNS